LKSGTLTLQELWHYRNLTLQELWHYKIFNTTGTLALLKLWHIRGLYCLLTFGALGTLKLKIVTNENGEASGRWQMLVGILISWWSIFIFYLNMPYSRKNPIFVSALNKQEYKGDDYIYNRECAANCSVRFPWLNYFFYLHQYIDGTINPAS
jgi:hypothetical protein